MVTVAVCLFIGASSVLAQEEDDRDWQDILEDVVRDAVEDSTSSKRLGRIRGVDVVNRSTTVVELEVELRGLTDPASTILTVEVFDESYDALPGFETLHDPLPADDGTLLVKVVYRGAEDVRSVGAKVNLVDAETNGVSTRRKVALPWEWTGDGSAGYGSSGGGMADPGGLATRYDTGGTVEERQPRVVSISPIPVGRTPAGRSNRGRSSGAGIRPANPPPPTSSDSRSGKAQSTSSPAMNSTSPAIGSANQGSATGPRPAPPPPPTLSDSKSGKAQPASPVAINPATAAIASSNVVMYTSVDLYKIAQDATWKSGRGTLPFNGKDSDDRGFVRALGTAALASGRSYNKVLQTHPERKDSGYISGTYTVVVPPAATHFEAHAGFLPKVTKSDGVRVSVYLRHGSRGRMLVREAIHPDDGVVALRGPIPKEFRGKEVSLMLRVDSGAKSTQDWFAWSAPMIK
jgi:hypothetical protein